MAKLKTAPRRGRKLSGSSLRRPTRSSRSRSSLDQLSDSVLGWLGPAITIGLLLACLVVAYIVVTGETVTLSTLGSALSSLGSTLAEGFADARDAVFEALGFG